MSIYATLYSFAIQRFAESNYHRLFAQRVPGLIDDAGPGWEWLPPPIVVPEDEPDDDTPAPLRAVVIVEEGMPKGTARCHQEYTDSLLILTGEEWTRITFTELVDAIHAKLEERYGQTPSAVLYSPDGKVTKIYPDDTPG